MKTLTISDRIASLLSDKKLSAIDFSKIIQVQRSTLSHILSGRNKPSLDLVERFHNAFPELSLEWLITGVGSMYKQSNELIRGESLSNAADLPDPKQLLIEQASPIIRETTKSTPETSPRATDFQQKPDRKPVKTIIFYNDDTFEMFTSLNT